MKDEFDELFKRCGATPISCYEVGNFLASQYSLPSRHYHNLIHIAKCLDVFDEYLKTARIFGLMRPTLEEQDIIRLSIWFHDVVYKIVVKSNNEEVSAGIAERKLKEHTTLSESAIKSVGKCILATKHQKLAENELEAIVCDLDLVSLATGYNEFCVNLMNIRKEYESYNYNIEFEEGNKAFFRTLLERESIYQTAPFQDMYEKRARKNVMERLK